MILRIHAIAGGLGLATIATFWTSTVLVELFGDAAAIAAVKTAILWGMIVLIPSMVTVGATGARLGTGRTDPDILAKKRRMPIIAANGLLVLVPSAVVLAIKANAGVFDSWFYGVQLLELAAGATNIVLMSVNLRMGLLLTGRIGAPVAD
ncbi:MAG: hypothetical protein KDJ16_16085 [Hyphomicrobiales bacterium]|nr:hypothetical protein [Hyphomicrobiales bacterium]